MKVIQVSCFLPGETTWGLKGMKSGLERIKMKKFNESLIIARVKESVFSNEDFAPIISAHGQKGGTIKNSSGGKIYVRSFSNKLFDSFKNLKAILFDGCHTATGKGRPKKDQKPRFGHLGEPSIGSKIGYRGFFRYLNSFPTQQKNEWGMGSAKVVKF
jgi:hypothetical protein